MEYPKQGKKLIDENEIQARRDANKLVFSIAMVLLGFSIIIVLFTGYIILALILAAVLLFLIRIRKKRGVLKVYFIQRPVTDKYVSPRPDTEGDSPDDHYLQFGDRRCLVPEETYRHAKTGDLFYVMYDAYDDKAIECFEVEQYDLAPSLDIREI